MEDEKTKTEDKPEEKKEEKPEEKPSEEDKPAEESADHSSLKSLDEAKATLDKIETATKLLDDKVKVLDEAAAKALLAGKGVIQKEPKKLTDIEYAEALMKGEVDPMKEDGFN